MKFLYHKEAGKNSVIIQDDEYNHVIKSLRKKIGDKLTLRNLKDAIEYVYKIEKINKKTAVLNLIDIKKIDVKKSKIQIAWAIIEPSVIKTTLPMLAQIGVRKIIFIKTKRSQNNFKIKIEKLDKIIKKSNQQSGRFDFMEFEVINSLEKYKEKYNNSFILDISGKLINNNIKNIKDKIPIIGPEGGFTEDELKMFDKYSLNTNILKSETAAVAISSVMTMFD